MRAQGLRLLTAALLALAWPAWACPVCVVGPGLSPAQQMMNADAVLLAEPERGGWKTVAVIKGSVASMPAGDAKVPEPAASPGPVLALRDPQSNWVALGPLPAAQLAWAKQVVASRPTVEMTADDWRERVRFHVPYLEHPVALVAETAYAETARAPYAAMRTSRPQLDAARLQRWLDDPALASRRSLYTLLLGIAGGGAAQQHIARQLEAADANDLAALLVADMELRGSARVAWIEKTYLSETAGWAPGVQPALLALSEQGHADAKVPRARVVEAYRRFIRSGHPLAGYVAPDLTRWKDWSAVPDYIALIRSGQRQQPASVYAIGLYLDASPQPEARAAAASLRKRTASD